MLRPLVIRRGAQTLRRLCASAESTADVLSSPRESMEYDVVVVGGGPSGLATAIRLKQLNADTSVCVVEKGSEVGNHILSGAVMEPSGLTDLIPDWKDRGAPLNVPVTDDKMYFLTEKGKIPLPIPPALHNDGNFIISLGEVCRWMAEQAEELGVEIYPGFAASEVVYDDEGAVKGIATRDVGIDKSGKAKPTFERGMELHARHTVFAEGCRGSLSRQLMDRFDLRKDCDVPTFGIGLKETWRLDPAKHKEGTVIHSVGWPTKHDTYAGSFMYHAADNMLSIGYVVGLDYANPYTNPYREFQAFKHHPLVRDVLEGATCETYGARALAEGGIQSLPKMTFNGGMLVGDAAGTLVVSKIKGSHTAIKCGALAAEAIHEDILERDGKEATSFPDRFRSSFVYKQLHEARNVRPAFAKWGLAGGILYSGVDQLLLRGKAPWTFPHHKPDHECLKPAAECEPIEYPKPDGKVSFDLLSNLARSGTNHNHDQPAHLTLKDSAVPEKLNLPVYDGPEARFCPAGVYEYVEDADAAPGPDGKVPRKLNINAQNCLHCKTCDIKDPSQNIVWVVPEGGGGPAYPSM